MSLTVAEEIELHCVHQWESAIEHGEEGAYVGDAEIYCTVCRVVYRMSVDDALDLFDRALSFLQKTAPGELRAWFSDYERSKLLSYERVNC